MLNYIPRLTINLIPANVENVWLCCIGFRLFMITFDLTSHDTTYDLKDILNNQ